MRTALIAGLVSGVLCVNSLIAVAAEGSSLRGLKPPESALESREILSVFTGTEPGLKRKIDGALPYLAPRLSLYEGTLEARRFTANDIDFRVGLHRPTGQNISALSEPSMHSLHEALPRYTLFSQIIRALPDGWGLGFGVRHSEYNFGVNSLLSFSAERNWGSFRSGYTLYSDSGGLAAAHRFQLSYSYGQRNTIGLAYTTGRDIENLALPAGLQFNDVRDWTLSGRHWLSPNWALTYDVSQEQNNLLRRQGLRLGVSRSF